MSQPMQTRSIAYLGFALAWVVTLIANLFLQGAISNLQATISLQAESLALKDATISVERQKVAKLQQELDAAKRNAR